MIIPDNTIPFTIPLYDPPDFTIKKYAILCIKPLFSKITESVSPPKDSQTTDPVQGDKITLAGATFHKIAQTVKRSPDT